MEGDEPIEELAHANGGGENTEGEAHSVVLGVQVSMAQQRSVVEFKFAAYLVDGDEETSVNKERPDEDVTEDTGHKVVGVMDHDGSIPVDGDESPSEGRGNDRPVDEARVSVMAEVERRQVEEVDDQDQLGPNEMGADEEHDEGEVQQVVEDEMTPHTGGSLNIVGILGKEMTDVTDLQDEEYNPAQSVRNKKQIPAGSDGGGRVRGMRHEAGAETYQ